MNALWLPCAAVGSSLPEHGQPAEEVLARLEELRAGDVRWRDGRALTLAYTAGPEVQAVAEEAYRRYMTENALNTDAFPSLRRMQQDVVDIVAGWLHGGPEAAGFMTTGGTESILLAVKAARERGRAERGVERPNVVLPASAHAAFEKAAHYFGLESRRIPVRADWRADVEAMAAAIDDSTVLVVASAPQYPQGVIDPVAEIAALAAERDISCHVDACMGGVTLPYLARLGQDVPPFDFAVEGVTSMSVDLHKFGYTAKGASVIVHRTRALRRYQVFVTERWLGGTYGSSGPPRHQVGRRHRRGLGRPAPPGRRRLPAPGADRPRRHRGPRRGHPRPAGAGAASAAGGDAAGLRRGRSRRARRVRRRRRAVAEGLVRRSPGSPAVAPLHGQRRPRAPHPRAPARPRAPRSTRCSRPARRGDRGAYGTVE